MHMFEEKNKHTEKSIKIYELEPAKLVVQVQGHLKILSFTKATGKLAKIVRINFFRILEINQRLRAT